jgi:serine phosphatase RsbU (regulator of sigma subunit)
MQDREIQSVAFQHAAMRSEKYRIIGMIGLFLILFVVVMLHFVFTGTRMELPVYIAMILLLSAMTVYEAGMLVWVSRALRTDTRIAGWIWGVNLFVETLFPTSMLFALTVLFPGGPYFTLVGPVGLVYFFVIILSTLRLSPQLCGLTGLFSAAGHLAVTSFTYWNYPAPDPAVSPFSLATYLTYASFLVVGGLVAASVAGQIRIHVGAALREAETRRQMERMQRDLQIARSIQQGLLPEKPPQVDGFDIAGWNLPADDTGGDFFDWQELPEGRIVVTLADVTGHGIGPALVTAACRAYNRASLPPGTGLSGAMGRINDLLSEDLPAGKLVQAAVAVLDPGRARIQLLSAGHSPLLLYTCADDRVENFNAHGLPFGVMAGMDYGPPQDIDLAPGDMLVLITDGFFEWKNDAGEDFGLERLMEGLRSTADLPAAEIISRLYGKVTEFAGGTRQDDDLTAVIVKRHVTTAGHAAMTR